MNSQTARGVALLVLVIVACAIGLSGGSRATAANAGASGGLIAFSRVHWSSCCVTAQIFVIRPDGKGLRRIGPAGAWADDTPAWSSNGNLIAFGRNDARGWRLYVMAANGRNPRPITGVMSLADSPSWSPDGRSVAFAGMPSRIVGAFSQQIYIASSSGRGFHQLSRYSSFRGGAGTPAWSPDGRTILFWGRTSSARGARTDLWVSRPNGSGLRRLVSNATDPAWAPSGKQIVFVRGNQIFSASGDGRNQRQLTRTPTVKSSPKFSSDGSRIVFANTHRYRNAALDDMRLGIVAVTGGALREITDTDPNLWAAAPAWSPAASPRR